MTPRSSSLPVLLALWLALLLLSLLTRPLLPVDETRYLAVAWEMWRRGDFLVPYLNGAPYSDKPPLFFWLIHAGWWLFGVTEWWPRCVAALVSLAALWATARLADAGIPLGSQTVLLKGINDNVPVMKQLMHGLLMRRVKPYYLYQCDPITGSAQFRTPVSKGIEIIEGLRGHTTGYAVPQFVIDAPGGGGKIPILPEYVVGRDGDDLLLRNFEDNVYRYTDTGDSVGADRVVPIEYRRA